MTRFKEGRRIERAIKNKDKDELDWAMYYVNSRLAYLPSDAHGKAWIKSKKEIQDVLDELKEIKPEGPMVVLYGVPHNIKGRGLVIATNRSEYERPFKVGDHVEWDGNEYVINAIEGAYNNFGVTDRVGLVLRKAPVG